MLSDTAAPQGSRVAQVTAALIAAHAAGAVATGEPATTASAAGVDPTRPTVLDCGGGTGAFAVPLARAGAQVTVIDISADALATLRRRVEEAGVTASVRAVAGDVETLGDLDQLDELTGPTGPGPFDLVLAHGVLDAVDDVAATLGRMAAAVRPGGVLSVLVANPVAGVIARALAGEPGLALAELRALDASTDASADASADPDNPAATNRHAGQGPAPAGTVDAARIAAICTDLGLQVESRRGIGVFSDLVPGSALEAPGARAALAELDAEAADRPVFADLAGRIHLLVRVPGPPAAGTP